MARSIQLASAWPWRSGVALACAILVAAAARPAHADGEVAVAHVPRDCARVSGTATPDQTALAASLRGNVDKNPLYGLFSPAAGFPTCSLHYEADGAVALAYRFRDGGSLTIRNDPAIEATEQRVSLKRAPSIRPEAVLSETAQFVFGEKGCRIDWSEPEVSRGSQKDGTTETAYHGDVCNCKAAVRRKADGRLTGLSLTAAC